jgi:signal transduction histidine kinase
VGNHKVASARLRTGNTSQHAKESTNFHIRGSRGLTLRDWPVSSRLLAVIVLALIMGLVFGGLRVSDAAGSASQFGRVTQLAKLGQQVTVLVQALEDERDETTGNLPVTNLKTLQPWYNATNAAATQVQALTDGIGGSFPANIQAKIAAVRSASTPSGLKELRSTAQASQSALAVIADYAAPIGDMISLNDQIAQGTSDASLANDVQTLNSLSLAKDQAAQQRALLFNALQQQLFADGVQQALTTAQSEELTELTAFNTTATPGEQSSFGNTVAGPLVNQAQGIETYILSVGSLDIGAGALGIGPGKAPGVWYSAMSDRINRMQQVEQGVAGSIVARAQVLQQGAERSALITAIITAAILLLVLIATLAVARSLVQPLRRLRAGALDVAAVQLPERVRQLSEAEDPAASLEVAPIDVLSADEIGQVARAFDQVHAEAVRLAGNEAMLRTSFNAMFVNLSRRSQSLIERLARMIDSLEQNEDDPDRLSNLFSMDHLVTRMRRNSENLLLLAGHEGARKWSGPVLLTDVARAATSEIEQYSRVTLNVQPGVAISGQAVSDIVHLLAEVIENATTFSPKDTQVYVSAQELTSGGVLIEVSDSGVGLPDAMLAEMNWRLDNPPVIDVSVSRHMGLFAVARLAERHGVRVRLRARTPQGLTALVWLPDSVTERGTRIPTGLPQQPAPQASFQPRRTPGDHSIPMRPAADGQFANDRREAVMPAQSVAGTRQTAQAADPAGKWFRNPPSAAGMTSNGGSLGAAPQAGGGMQTGTDWWAAEGTQAAQIIADPVRGDHTSAGLPVRVPQANLIPGSAGGSRSAGGDATSGPAGSYETQTPSTPRPHRSPEMARNRLSGFQRGVRRGKGEALRAGEGADR